MRATLCRCGLACLLLTLFAGWPGVRAQSRVSGVRLGASPRPASPRANVFGAHPKGVYTLSASTASFSKVLSFNLPLADRQSLRISAEYARLSSFFIKTVNFEEKTDWKFYAVPITVGYEYTLTDESRRFVPVVGFGVSAYFSRMKRLDAGGATYVKRYGVGYGAQATLGLRTNLGRRLFMLARGRYRLINGLSLVGSDHEAAEFPVFDFAVGFGFRF